MFLHPAFGINAVMRFFPHSAYAFPVLIGSVARDAIGAFWKDKDVCLSFSDYEGRSISIMEAMANGAVPVVTATSGVIHPVIFPNTLNVPSSGIWDKCSHVLFSP